MVEEICKHCKHCLSCMCGDEFKTCYLKKTPHERAEIWAEKKLREHHNYSSMSERVRKVWIDAYVQDYMAIATEQKAIDIDKACEWLTEEGHKFQYEDMVSAFRKYMEEQI